MEEYPYGEFILINKPLSMDIFWCGKKSKEYPKI